jgi:hypothetical protein
VLLIPLPSAANDPKVIQRNEIKNPHGEMSRQMGDPLWMTMSSKGREDIRFRCDCQEIFGRNIWRVPTLFDHGDVTRRLLNKQPWRK